MSKKRAGFKLCGCGKTISVKKATCLKCLVVPVTRAKAHR